MVLLSGELHVSYEGQPTTIVRKGSYAYGPAQLPHEAYCADGDDCILFIAFESPVDAIPLVKDDEHK
jgi:quercetin dioxygenase-like cupin family protein